MTTPSRHDIIRMSQQAGWSGLYFTFNKPTGTADWKMVKERLTVPVTIEQVESFFHAAYAAGAAAERQRWAEVKSYLVAARDGSMSRNNSENLAGELLEQLERDIIEPASTAPVPVYCRHQWVSTGAMKPGECRCIQCGTWGLITPASTSPPQAGIEVWTETT